MKICLVCIMTIIYWLIGRDHLLIIISYFASVMMHSSFIFKELVLKLQDFMNDELLTKNHTQECIFDISIPIIYINLL